MGCCKIKCLLLILITAFVGYYVYTALYTVPPLPTLSKDQWWGPGQPSKNVDKTIRPFKIEFQTKKIEELKARLEDTAWLEEPLEGVGFQYGFNSKYLKTVIDFWRTKYDFAERQKIMNSFPQFKTAIQGLDIHFVHVKQANPMKLKVIPLLLLHGWPGSFMEFNKLIFQLVSKENQHFVLDIVAPSLPGYGYSQGASKPGLGASQMGVVMANLMERLGYDRYVVQGGDWGSFVGGVIARIYPERVIGYHTNMAAVMSPLSTLKHLFFSLYPSALVEEKHVSKMYPVGSFYSFLIEEMGYMHIQATKPDTVGVALKDSPIGLAAYILEKFSTWTNKEWKPLPDGGLAKKYDLSELLDNVMVYWHSGSITTSMRLYSESFNKAQQSLQFDRIPIKVPTAIVRCSNEIAFSSECQLKEVYVNIIRLRDLDDVGHFAAFENPKEMAQDILASIFEFEEYYKKASQKNQEL